MGFSDRLKELGEKAKDAATEHKDQINQAVETAGVVADRKTGGKYRDKIHRATQKTGEYVEKVTGEGDVKDEGTGESKAGPPPPPSPPVV